MDFTFSAEQEQLRASVARYLSTRSSSEKVREIIDGDGRFDRDVWQGVIEQGLVGLNVPEEYGGQGFSRVELGIVLEEMGRVLLVSPFFATAVLATNAVLTVAEDAQRKDILPRLASGETIATVAFNEGDAAWKPTEVPFRWRRAGDGFVVDGGSHFVVDGLAADLVLVAARAEGDDSGATTLFAVPAGTAGVTRNDSPGVDRTRALAHVEFDGAAAQLIGPEGGATPGLTRAFAESAVMLTTEMVGAADRALTMAVEHAKTREQFGRPIGSFQAIKHKCADMLMHLESAKSAAYYALWAAGDDHPDFPLLASMAKAYVSDTLYLCASENIQIHGGIGFTWEHDAHLYFKRATWARTYLGSADHHRAELADELAL